MHYCQKGNQSSLVPLSNTATDQADRKMCVTRVKLTDRTVLSISSYDSNKSRGAITMRFLSENLDGGSLGSSVRIGFTEPSNKRQKPRLPTTLSKTTSLSTKSADKRIAKTTPIEFTEPSSKWQKPRLPTTLSKTTSLSIKSAGKRIAKAAPIGFTEPSSKRQKPRLPPTLSKTTSLSIKSADKRIAKTTPMRSKTEPPLLPAALIAQEGTLKSIAVAGLSTPKMKTKHISRSLGQQIKGKGKREKETNVVTTNYTNLLVTPDPKKRKLSHKKKCPDMCPPASSEDKWPKSTKNITDIAPQIEPVGVAVSPEQRNKYDATQAPTVKPKVDGENSISNFFKKSKVEKKGSQPITTKTKKVQFKEVKSAAKSIRRSKNSEHAATADVKLSAEKRTLRESEYCTFVVIFCHVRVFLTNLMSNLW